jgi:hypothetical protein
MAIGLEQITGEYEVDDGPVVLRIYIGEGQFGSSAVLLGEAELASGNLAMVRVGMGTWVRGQRLIITSTVTDVQRRHNRTSVTYELSGGKKTQKHKLEHEVDEGGGSVIYTAELNLV